MSLTGISQIFITKMSTEDIEHIVEIEKEAYGEHHWSKSSFYDEMSNNLAHYYCAKTPEGELAGYAGTWHILDEGHILSQSISSSVSSPGSTIWSPSSSISISDSLSNKSV